MDIYYEQTVAAANSRSKSAFYALCWVVLVVLLVLAAMLGAGIVANDAAQLRINWLNLLGMAICLVLAGIIFRRKDALRMEYDYLLDNDTLEIFGVYNKRRRRRLGSIHLAHVKSGGSADCNHCQSLLKGRNVRVQAWYGDHARNYLYYDEANMPRLALLQLDDQLAALIRRQLPVGAWQSSEGESADHASLSR